MPTIDQLPQATDAQPDDMVMLDQGGTLRVTTVATLLQSKQDRMSLAAGALLGRASPLPGAPEPVPVGQGLAIAQGALVADTAVMAALDSPAFTGTPTAPTLPASDTSDALATTAFVQAHTAQASPVKAVAGRTGYVELGVADVAGLAPVAASGAYADLRNRPAGDHFNVLDFGAVADGATDCIGAINAAIAAASAAGGGEVFIPPGNFRIANTSASFVIPRSNVHLRGAGMGATTILVDDSTSTGRTTGITNWVNGWTSLDRFTISDLTLKGRADQTRAANGSDNMRLGGTNLLIERVESRYSMGFGFAVLRGSGVVVRDCVVFRSMADGIVTWSTSDVVIQGNRIIQTNDDCISCHSQDGDAAPVRSGLVIADNTITESPGIKVLGAKATRIANNVMRRIMGHGIHVAPAGSSFAQGNTPMFSISIEGNIIQDVFHRQEGNGTDGSQWYIVINGPAPQPGAGTAIPGEQPAGGGAAVPLYGTAGTAGTLYGNNSLAAATPVPRAHWIAVRNNILARTLPAVTAVSQWGYSTSAGGLWVGAHSSDGSGFYNGAIPDSALQTLGIWIAGPLADSVIAGNIIDTSGMDAIMISSTDGKVPIGPRDLDGLVIADNRLRNFRRSAINMVCFAAPTPQRIAVLGNEIDGDPYFVSGYRAANGSWINSAGWPMAMQAPQVAGIRFERNRIRNVVSIDTLTGGTRSCFANVVSGQPAAAGWSTANKGVGTWPAMDAGWRFVVEDSDPTSATYGQTLQVPASSSAAQPASGFYFAGQFVSAAAPAVTAGGQTVLGWTRLTTGSSHVAGTDWSAVYGTSGVPLAPLNNAALAGTPTAPTAAPGTAGAQIATTGFVAAALASPPAIGATAPAAGSFTTLAAGGPAASATLGADANGSLQLGRLGAAVTPYVDFLGNNLGSGNSVRLVNDAAQRLTVSSSLGDAVLNVAGTLAAQAVAVGGAAVATQAWVAGNAFEATANKGAAGGYAALDSTGKVPAAQLPASVTGALSYQGAWNAATNTPPLASGVGTKGFYYSVSAAGGTALDGISTWNPGDHVAFNGTAWERFQGPVSGVISVAGRTGVVTLGTADIAGLGSLAGQGAGAVVITGGSLAGITGLALANATGSGAAEGAAYALSGPAGVARQLVVQTAGSGRWAFGANGTAETGGNAGSDFALARFSDTGTPIDTPLLVSRATGAVQVGSAGIAIAGAPVATQSWVAAQGYETPAHKGQPNGYAALDGFGLVPASQLPASVLGALNYQGAWDAAANLPALASGAGGKGAYYTVSVAGTTAIDGEAQWSVGDHIVFNGLKWEKFGGAVADVVSVAGRTGAVALSTADIAGLGSLAGQGAGAVAITGGSIDGVAIGGKAAGTGVFSTLAAAALSVGGAPAAVKPGITVFTSSGTFTPKSTSVALVCLVVGGGGGGGYGAALAAGGSGSGGGGGGGGGLNLAGPIPLANLPGTLTVTVGAGGAGGTSTAPAGGQGGLSSVTGAGMQAINAYGGGGGAAGQASAGSGGGGSGDFLSAGGNASGASGGSAGVFGVAGGSGVAPLINRFPTGGGGGGGCSAAGAATGSNATVDGGGGGGAGQGFNAGAPGTAQGYGSSNRWASGVGMNNAGHVPAFGAGSGGGGGTAGAAVNGNPGCTGGPGGGGGGGAAALAPYAPGNGAQGGAGQVVILEW